MNEQQIEAEARATVARLNGMIPEMRDLLNMSAFGAHVVIPESRRATFSEETLMAIANRAAELLRASGVRATVNGTQIDVRFRDAEE